MNSCEKAATICSKTQYQEATFMEIMKLKFHMLICKHCSKFSKKNTRLTTLCGEAKLRSLSEKDKLQMKQQLEKQN